MKLRLKELGPLEIDRARVNPNFDRQAVSRLIQNHRNAVKAQADGALKNNQREVDAMRVVTEAHLLSVDSGKAKRVGAKMRKEIEALAAEKAPIALRFFGAVRKSAFLELASQHIRLADTSIVVLPWAH